MRVALQCFLMASLVTSTGAFAPQLGVRCKSGMSPPTMLASMDCDDVECVIPEFDDDVDKAATPVGASVFRNSMLTDADGNVVKLGDKMGSEKSVVVFLRHLG